MARDTPEDPDLIARVYPADPAGHARDVIMKHPWGVAREREPSLPARSRTSRESTVESQGGDELEGLPYLELRFSQLPRSSSGFVFGTSKATSDVVLPGWPGISRNHFALTYKNTFRDGKYRLVVRDLGSTSGTVVTYDRRGGERRSKFDWAVSGFVVPASAKTLIIEPHRSVRFRLVVPHHNLRSPDYIRNVERFRQGAAAAEDLLGVLGFQHGPETERPTGIHTPLEIPVFIKQDLIAQGASGVVSRYWNVSNGEEHACKQPVGKDYQKRAWEKEIDIMKQVSHVGQDPQRLHSKRQYSCLNRKTSFGCAFLSWSPSRVFFWSTCHSGASKMCTEGIRSHTMNA
jgi:serine/threonine-protein kinase Chk2